MDQDFDSFLNLDPNDYSTVSTSSDIKSVPSSRPQSSTTGTFANGSNQQTFQPPSFQYETHRQQTGLPTGGLATTFALNQASGLHYRPGYNGFVMPTETLNIPLSNLDDFDFNQSTPFDMDLEADSPSDMPAMFYPAGSSTGISPSQQAPPRIYPGMHSQQAAQAKAQAAQKQQEFLRSQQEPKQLPGQRPLPTQAPKAATSTPAPKDPHVEESISRLLSRMRQSSTASNVSEDAGSPADSTSHALKLKRDDEEMDEDERLLASEEGKKLSSKERRQLRNKVSARAFRSRRKEYITQLESELQAKVQEANDLRVQNQQLMEENTRLTDLTRMLLSSQSFSGFLQELSNSGMPLPNTTTRPVAQAQQVSPVRKDVSAHEAARQVQGQSRPMHVGMTLIPETPVDMSMLESGNVWNSILPSNDFQVFALTELPEPPQLDMATISQKPSAPNVSSSPKDLPVLPTSHVTTLAPHSDVTDEVDDSIEMDESDYDLYFTAQRDEHSSSLLSLPQSLSLTLSKAAVASESTASAKDLVSTTASWSALEGLCASLDETSARLDEYLV